MIKIRDAFLTNRKDSSSAVRCINALDGHSFSRPYSVSLSGGTTLTKNTLNSQQTMDKVIHSVSASATVHVVTCTSTYNVSKNIVLKNCGRVGEGVGGSGE